MNPQLKRWLPFGALLLFTVLITALVRAPVPLDVTALPGGVPCGSDHGSGLLCL